MGKYDGKTLLILGTSTTSVDIVEYARSQGAYVIVADYFPPEKSEAKRYADESVMISTTDIDALCEFGKERGIDGVFCGVSEINLVSARAVSERLGLPCYFTAEQWEATEDKAVFKKLCETFGIPCAKRFALSETPTAEELAEIAYPVVVKPVDRSACIGIHVCYNEEELLAGYRDAYELSFKHQVIVEEYILGEEFTVYYDISDGKCALASMGEKYLNFEQEGLTPLPEAFLFPSRHLPNFICKADNGVKRMIESLGMKNGTIFLQGITDGDKIAVFEAGLRINGSEMYKVVNEINGVNAMHMLVDYTLTGKASADLSLEDPTFGGKRVCYLYIVNRGGQIAKMTGFDKIGEIPGVYDHKVIYQEGDVVPRSGTLKQRMMRVCLICDNGAQLKKAIETIQNTISAVDTNGQNMLLTPFDTEKVSSWDAALKARNIE